MAKNPTITISMQARVFLLNNLALVRGSREDEKLIMSNELMTKLAIPEDEGRKLTTIQAIKAAPSRAFELTLAEIRRLRAVAEACDTLGPLDFEFYDTLLAELKRALDPKLKVA